MFAVKLYMGVTKADLESAIAIQPGSAKELGTIKVPERQAHHSVYSGLESRETEKGHSPADAPGH
jgi:hypothetical protein